VNEAALDVVARLLVKVLRAQIPVGLVACEHVIDGDQHGMANRDDRPSFASPRDALRIAFANSCESRSLSK
jgi:hypothetical protein